MISSFLSVCLFTPRVSNSIFSKQLTSPEYLVSLGRNLLVYIINISSDYKSKYSKQVWEHTFPLREVHVIQVATTKCACLLCGGLLDMSIRGNVEY